MDKISQAKSKLLLNNPFFATLLLGTEVCVDNNCPTAYTTGKKIGYNEKFMLSLPVKVIEFVFAHEVCHDMLLHMLRMHTKNPKLWNIACDFAINLMLKDAGFEVWEKCCIDEKYRGMSAEQIYDKLQQDMEKKRKQQQANGSGGGDPLDDMEEDGLGRDVQDHGDMSPAEEAKVRQGVQQRVAQAAAMARMAGKLPAGMDRFLDKLLNPSAPWEDLLRDYLTRIVQEDESWARRNRRFASVVLPARYSEKLGEIIHIGDTSGSISSDELCKVGAESGYIMENLDPELMRFVWADTKVDSEQTFGQGDHLDLKPTGGGGTDMRVPLTYVERYNPTVVVLHTDGATPWPDTPTPYPLIICCTTELPCPSWANTVRIKV